MNLLQQFKTIIPCPPVIILSESSDTRIAIKSVQAGAQDYIVKGQFSGMALRRAIVVAIERQKLMTSSEDSHLQRQAELEKLSVTDELTGLNNRRHLRSTLMGEMMRTDRYGSPLSLIMLDLDHFKKINDTYGHEVGDMVLAGTATILKQQARLTDIVARYGGEEFCILLPETNVEGAIVFAERVRVALGRFCFKPSSEVSFHMTCSVGVAPYEKGIFDTVGLISRADKALYQAKESGRDRVCAFQP